MKITFELPDNVVAGFLNYVIDNGHKGMCLVSSQLDTYDFVDGNEIKLPRKEDGDGNG